MTTPSVEVKQNEGPAWHPLLLPDGAIIFRRGESLRNVFLVTSGTVLLLASGDNEGGLVGLRTQGDLLGAASAICRRLTYRVTAAALGPCELRQTAASKFLESRHRDPAAARWLADLLAAEADAEIEWLVALSAGDLRTRLQHILIVLFRAGSTLRVDGSLRLSRGITRTFLAKLVSVERESVARLFTKLERDRVVLRENDWLVVPPGSPMHAHIQEGPAHARQDHVDSRRLRREETDSRHRDGESRSNVS
jgi:CRP-like cAMP-binding protein